jgi:hypothetical protein
MNERIKQLAEQAGYKPLPGFNFANSFEETYLKKFAELIVRECAKLGDKAVQDGEWPGDVLHEHFGVE